MFRARDSAFRFRNRSSPPRPAQAAERQGTAPLARPVHRAGRGYQGIHDEPPPRPRLRPQDAAQELPVADRGQPVARLRHRPEHHRVQRRVRHVVPRPRGRAHPPAREFLFGEGRSARPAAELVPRLSRHAATAAQRRRARRLCARDGELRARRRTRATSRCRRHQRLLRLARDAARIGPTVPGRRLRHSRARRRRESSFLARRARWRVERGR